MKKEKALLFVPLVGKTSACRQKEGLKLIKYLPRLTAVLPQSGKDAMKSPSFGTPCHFPHKGGRATGSTRYLTQGWENNGCFTSYQNVGQALSENQENLIACRSDVSPTNQGENSFYNVGFTPDLHQPLFNLINPSPALRAFPDYDLPGRCLPARGEENALRGFTLIELLVVVLIIGILAAVALPQYQKAVKKAKYTKMLAWVKKVGEAQTQYYLENGGYTTSLESLGFAVDTSKKCDGWLSGGPIYKIDGICLGVVNQPETGTVWGSIPPGGSDWNGYTYLQSKYGGVPAKQVICMESRNQGKEDPHCTGTRVAGNAYGTFYKLP